MKYLFTFYFLVLNAGSLLSQGRSDGSPQNVIDAFLKSKPILVSNFQTNQDQYIPGDTIYFSAFFKLPDGTPPYEKTILRIKLRNSRGAVLRSEFVSLVGGSTYGQIPLPDTVGAGIFKIEIAQNTERGEPLLSRDLAIVKQNEVAFSGLVSFYPEGGKLIASVPNRVLLYSTYSGNSIHIVNEQGITEEIVKLDSLGFGLFTIKPELERVYFAITKAGKIKLPSAIEDGAAIILRGGIIDGASLQVHVPVNSKFRKQPVTLILVSDGKVSYTSLVNLNQSDSVSIELPVSSLSPSMNEILLVSGESKLIASRSFMGSEVSFIKIKTNAISFQRDSLLVNVSVKTGNETRSKFSVSLVNRPVFGEFRSSFPLNNLYLIKKEPLINWEKILQNENLELTKYSSKIKMRGKAFFTETGQSVPDSTIIFCYLQKNLMGYEAVTQNNGFFELLFLYDFYGHDKIFLFAEHKGKYLRNVSVIWDAKLENDNTPPPNFEVLDMPSRYGQFKENLKLIDQSYSYFLKKDNQELVVENLNKDFEEEFMEADLSVNVADYVLFPTMKDLVREVIPNLQIRTSRGEDIVRVIFSSNSIKPADDPLYIIDGRMTKDTKLFLSLKPVDLLKIKVEKDIYKLSRIGFLGKNGIVYVQSKREKVNSIPQLPGEYPVVGLILPQVRVKSKEIPLRYPDFRSSLYWNPYVKTDISGEANVSVRLSDDVGKMILRVAGVTETGHVFNEEKLIEVVYKKELGKD